MTKSELIDEINDGNVIILPTETVYGIACLPENEFKLNELKQRNYQPSAFIYHSVEQLFKDVKLDEYIQILVSRLLPGPFTLLLPAGGVKMGVRIPEHDICLDFLRILDKVLVMTSANLHKNTPSITYEQAKSIFPELNGLNGGACKYSRPSVIIDLSNSIR